MHARSSAAATAQRGRHVPSYSGSIGQKAQLVSAYQELGKELHSTQVKVVGNYTLGRVIGEGSFGQVRLGVHRLTGTRVAIKHIPKSSSPPLLTREIHHHRRLHHPSVVQLYEIIATEHSIWLVTELCAGGELFDYLVEKGRLTEAETRRIFGQICLGMHYVHKEGVVHRDLKLENVLLDERCNAKVADFGFGREYEQRRLMETFCGTTGYAAPEMLAGRKYMPEEVDVWSMGIILYTLLAGSLPFDDDDEEVMKEKIIRGEYVLPDFVSREARDLIFNILQPDPKDRLSIEKMLSHPWFTTPPSQHDFEFAFSPSPALRHSVIQEEESPLPTSPSLDDPFVAHGISIQRSGSSSSIESAGSKGFTQSPLEISKTGLGILSESETSERSSTADSDLSIQGSSSRSGASSPVTSEDLPPATVDPAEPTVTAAPTSSESSSSTTTTTTTSRTKLGLQHPNASESTIRKVHESPVSLKGKRKQTVPTTPIHEEADDVPSSSTATTAAMAPPTTPAFAFPLMPSPARPPVELPGSTDASARRRMASIPNSPAFIGSPSVGAGPSRTPSRTKRRSVGSTISERMLPLEDPTASAAPYDYLSALRSAHHGPPISTPADEALLVSLGVLGFEVGQISHSVRTHACDASGALYWLLKRKREAKEAADKSAVPTAANSIKEPEKGEVAKPSSPILARKDLLSPPASAGAAKAPSPAVAVPSSAGSESKSSTAKSEDWKSAGGSGISSTTQQSRTSAATGATDYFSAFGEASERSEASSHDNSPAPPKSPPSTPPLAATAPPTALKGLDSTPTASSSGAGTPTGSASKSPDRKRSQSVSMLQRATSALAPKKSDDGNRLSKGKQKEVVPESDEQQPAGKKEAKAANVRALEEGSKSGSNLPLAALFSRRTVSDTRPPIDRLVMTSIDIPAEGRPSVSLPASPVRATPANAIRRGSDPLGRDLSLSPKSPRSGDRRPTISSSGTFETLSTIAGDDSLASPKNRPKVNNLFSSFRLWFNEDRRKRKRKVSTGPYGAPLVRGPSGSGSIRRGTPGSARKGPDIRPSPVARQSSTGSRRSSIHSSRRVSLEIQAPGRLRRRSDSSRASFSSLTGSKTPTSDHGSVRSTRRSADQVRRNHMRQPSTGSAGSRRSAAHLSPTTSYRRTPSGTTVRRISAHASGRPHLHSRTHSQASSIRSFSSEDEDGSDLRHVSGYDVEETIVEEAEGAEEEADKAMKIEKDRAYSERARALRKLSGDFSREDSLAASSQGDGPRRPVVAAVFTAHKSHNVFGTPTASARSSWGKASPIVAQRPALRDVFARPSTEDSEWVDEDDDPLAGYSCGLGQSFTRTDNRLSMPSSSRGPPKTPPVGLSAAEASTSSSLLGEGRYAGVVSASRGDVATSNWRPSARNKGTSFRGNAIVEEEEEEEE